MNIKNTIRFCALAAFVAMLGLVSACDYDPVSTTCNPNTNRCWAHHPDWDAYAEAQTSANIQAAVNAGILVADPTKSNGDACWDVVGTDNHVCVVYVGGALLYGRPTNELPLSYPAQSCWFKGVWSYNRSANGQCYGVMDGVAFVLNIDPL